MHEATVRAGDPQLSCKWQETGIRYVAEKVFCRLRVRKRAVLLCTHYNLPFLLARPPPKETLDCWRPLDRPTDRSSPTIRVSLRLPWKVAFRSDGRRIRRRVVPLKILSRAVDKNKDVVS